jgi:hypothetical protein
MAHAAVSTLPDPRPVLAKILKWAAIAVLVAGGVHFFWTSALRYTDVTPETYRRFWPYHGWLMMHIAGGSLALLLGPLQLWSGLRRRYMTLHRWTGRLYLAGVAIGATGATYMGFVTKYQAFGISLVAMAFAWASASAMAYVAIRKRQVAAHKEWVIRSYVVTYGFVTYRTLQQVHFLSGLKTEALAMNVWLSWVIPLLCAEMVLQWRRTMGPAKRFQPQINTDERR